MKLTMKNYKGYNKLPYCEPHYPTTKFTAVADTPENRRLQKNTANQSNVVYHKKFEEEKGAFQAVADTPESMRLKKMQEQTSDLAYKSKEGFLIAFFLFSFFANFRSFCSGVLGRLAAYNATSVNVPVKFTGIYQ